MKELNIYKLSPLFLAIFLAISACSIPPPPEDPVTPDSKNGALYYTEGAAGEWVIVGIADPAEIADNRAAFAPKTGYWYVIGIGSESNAGGDPVSMGTIQVNGNSLTFSPFADMGFPAATFTGALGNGFLVMESIPGRNYTDIRVEEGRDFDFKSSDDPWGTGGKLPSVPGAPDFGGGAEAPPPSGASFNPGKAVTDVIVIDSPSVKTAYEGFPVDLTGIKVEIYYSTGEKVTKTSANAKEFIVDPPVYTYPNAIHTLRYVAEYNNPPNLASSLFLREFRAPSNAGEGYLFYELTNPYRELEATGTANKEYFEGYSTFDFSGISVKAEYSNGAKTITPTSAYQTRFISASSPDDSELLISVGSKYAVVPIKFNKVYSISSIQLEGAPSFSAQVLYDDPRFFSGNRDKHWLSKFNNVSVKFIYKGTSATKSVKITEAIGNGLEADFPPNLTDKNPKITFIYRGDSNDFKTDYTVPVYNRLSGIELESTVGKIILKGSGPLPPDDEQSFLKQIRIKAFYQMGSDKNKIVARDNVLIYSSLSMAAMADNDLIYAPVIETNVNTEEGGILTAANSKAYDDKNKLAKAKVTFTTTSAGDSNQETAKSAVIEVGVTGYQ